MGALGLGSIPGWSQSRCHALSKKGLSSPVWATLCPWVGTSSCWPSLPTSTNPIQGTLENPQHFAKRVGESPQITWIPPDEEPLCGNATVYAVVTIIIIIIIIIIQHHHQITL